MILKPLALPKTAEVTVPAGAEIGKVSPASGVSTDRMTKGSPTAKTDAVKAAAGPGFLDELIGLFATVDGKKAEAETDPLPTAPNAIAATTTDTGTPGAAAQGTTQNLDTAPAAVTTITEDTDALKSELSLGTKEAQAAELAWAEAMGKEAAVATAVDDEAMVKHAQHVMEGQIYEAVLYADKIAEQMADALDAGGMPPMDPAAAGGAPAVDPTAMGGPPAGVVGGNPEELKMMLAQLFQDPEVQAVIAANPDLRAAMTGGGGGAASAPVPAPAAETKSEPAPESETEPETEEPEKDAAAKTAAVKSPNAVKVATKAKALAAEVLSRTAA